jgi:hypothetical protein
MAKRRSKSPAERKQDRENVDDKVRVAFLRRLGGIESLEDAKKLCDEVAPGRSASQRYRRNFRYFMVDFTPPHGASGEELVRYIAMIERLDEKGQLAPGARKTVVAALRRAMECKPE